MRRDLYKKGVKKRTPTTPAVSESRPKKIFAIDLDGTLCDIDTVFFKTAFSLSFFGNEVPESFLDEREYITLTDCGILSEDDEFRILTLFDVFRVWETLEVFPGVPEFLQKISAAGHSIVYITSRRSVLRQQTTTWMQNRQLPRPADVDFGSEDPLQRVVLMMNGPNSKRDNLEKLYATGKELYYFENDPYYVEEACKLGIKNIYSFKEPYVLTHKFSSDVTLLARPKTNAYAQLDGSIFA